MDFKLKLDLNDIKVRRPSATPGSYHRDKRHEEKSGGKPKHSGRNFQSYMEDYK